MGGGGEGGENSKVCQSHKNSNEACLEDNFLLAFQLILARIVAESFMSSVHFHNLIPSS